MRKFVAGLGLVASLLAYSAPAATTITLKNKQLQQTANDDTLRRTLVEKFKQQVIDSTVCIKASAYYSQPIIDPANNGVQNVLLKEEYFGTGNVIKSEQVNGKTEYILITNNHVGKPASFKFDQMGARTLEQYKMSVVDSIWDNDERDDITLEVIARDPDNDIALMRTVNCNKKLEVVEPEYDFKGDVRQGEEIFSVGFPHGTGKTLQKGEITNTHFFDPTPAPHYVYTGRISIDPGQSGSNVYTVEFTRKKGSITAHLKHIGNIYAKNPKDDSTRMITATKNFSKIIQTMKSVESKRPKLDTPVDAQALKYIADQEVTTFDAFSRRYFLTQEDTSTYTLKEYVVQNDILRQTMHLDTRITIGECGINVDRFFYEDEDTSHVISTSNFSPNMQKTINDTYTNLLNYFKNKKEIEKLQSNKYRNEETSQLQEYREILDKEDGYQTYVRWLFVHSDLKKKKIIEDDFW